MSYAAKYNAGDTRHAPNYYSKEADDLRRQQVLANKASGSTSSSSSGGSMSSSAVNKIVSRGYPRAQAEQWVADHPGDEGRIDTAFPAKSAAPAAAPKPAPAAAPASVAAMGGASPVASVTGAMPGAGAGAGSGSEGAPASLSGIESLLGQPDASGNMLGTMSGSLRALGMRTPARTSLDLASKGKVY